MLCKYILYNIHFILDKQSIEPNRFILEDTFGDGWHSAKLRIADEYGHDSLHSLVVGDDHVSDLSYCFDTAIAKNGRTVTAGVSGLQPTYGWEVNDTA